MHVQNNLGILYKYGYRVELDLYEAKKWFKLAADQGHEGAKKSYENFFKIS